MDFETAYDKLFDITSPDEQLAYSEELVKQAENNGQIGWVYLLAMFRSEVLYKIGRYKEFLVSFDWCWNTYLKNEKIIPKEEVVEILTHYRWAIQLLVELPQIDKGTIVKSLEEFNGQVEKHNFSKRSVYFLNYQVLLAMNDFKEADKHWDKWRQEEIDELTVCAICESHEVIMNEVRNGNVEGALELFRNIEESKQTCIFAPKHTYAEMCVELVQSNPEIAETIHQKGYFAIASDAKMMKWICLHTLFLTATNSPLAEATWSNSHDLFEQGESRIGEFYFLLSTFCLFNKNTKLIDKYNFDIEKVLFMLQESADLYDIRNENDGFQDIMNHFFELTQ
ncbi:hypothetical protein [Bacillus bombysepticus]|uniref:hypothetical protein n=1 Tax=Bacillus bombysepticus TaxID=658666 RepID=UPI003017B9D4